MKMKKCILILMAGIVILTTFSGCKGDVSKPDIADETSNQNQVEITSSLNLNLSEESTSVIDENGFDKMSIDQLTKLANENLSKSCDKLMERYQANSSNTSSDQFISRAEIVNYIEQLSNKCDELYNYYKQFVLEKTAVENKEMYETYSNLPEIPFWEQNPKDAKELFEKLDENLDSFKKLQENIYSQNHWLAATSPMTQAYGEFQFKLARMSITQTLYNQLANDYNPTDCVKDFISKFKDTLKGNIL